MSKPTPPRAPQAEIGVGTVLGSWKLVAELGAGAMGRVYRARHARLGREVAIKVLNPEHAARRDVVERFFREARVANEIDHPHIVEVTDFVEAPGSAYLVMELLEGRSLRDLTAVRGEGYPSIARLVALLGQVCDALHAAHEKGVIHRDLKPDNVFVVERDGREFAKVLDFGVAKLADPADHAATTAGMILGTPHYMAPEQALGREVDRRTDVWAAGVVLHELLAGAVPFKARSFVELAMAIRERPPAPMPESTPGGERIPADVAAVVARCLEKRPADRYATMAELAEALRGRRAAARAPGARRGRLVAAALAALALVGGGAAALRLGLPQRLGGEVAPAWSALRERVDDATSTRAPPAPAPKAAAPSPAPSARPAQKAAPAPAARPAPRPTVELLLRSTPPGARVVRLDTGERLGATPVRVNVPRRAASIWIEMTAPGFRPVKFQVDLRRDTTANVAFERASRRTSRRR
jgi:eukaryotic-like serine/threonine-protein kinase